MSRALAEPWGCPTVRERGAEGKQIHQEEGELGCSHVG